MYLSALGLALFGVCILSVVVSIATDVFIFRKGIKTAFVRVSQAWKYAKPITAAILVLAVIVLMENYIGTKQHWPATRCPSAPAITSSKNG